MLVQDGLLMGLDLVLLDLNDLLGSRGLGCADGGGIVVVVVGGQELNFMLEFSDERLLRLSLATFILSSLSVY